MYRCKFILLYLTVLNVGLTFGKVVDKNLKVELVQVLFRHGARTPIDSEAKLLDHNQTTYEPWGLAQLTNQGMMQEYQIGEMLRKRYNNFLTDSYKTEHVYAYASAVGRTKVSLELVLASLYPPSKKLTWNQDLRWLPIQTFSNPRPLDILIKSRDCPKYVQALKNLYNTTEIKQQVAKHEEALKALEGIYGQKFDLDELFSAYNAIVIHKNLNLPLPGWYNNELFAKITEAGHFYLDTLSYTTTLRRLNGGPLVRKFVENMKNSEAKLTPRKIYLYSAHDKTLHAFAKSHNLTLPRLPDYGSAIIIEKLRDENDKTHVKILFWSGEPKILKTLKLENCGEVCEMEKYLKIVNPVLPSDDDMICLLKNLRPKDLEKILNTDFVNTSD